MAQVHSPRDNPVAAVLLSKMGDHESERVAVKRELLRMLVRLELDGARQRLLFRFFEMYLTLSEQEEIQLRNEVSQMETKEAKKVNDLLISYERQGMEKGKMDVAKRMLAKGCDVPTICELTGLPAEALEKLKE